VKEVKTKHSVINAKEWSEALADIWQLLVKESCQHKKNLSIPRNAAETFEMNVAPEKRRAS
jgi:hypothetical protein